MAKKRIPGDTPAQTRAKDKGKYPPSKLNGRPMKPRKKKGQ